MKLNKIIKDSFKESRVFTGRSVPVGETVRLDACIRENERERERERETGAVVNGVLI